ncbi:hypothetical protein GUITHDRAFT_136846 [Guillardia theta CCMP2712]|uniref:UBA domain-containing protein n=1 Tax=Guillardia theta (strain CCMP2712) TaxID=905079 RepID=L1JJL7_GUITC|nr:hypothetical protein GUITHDRAFT_136846 [Guillardia theta CCMP2712]EKX48334.1 hypothetical protein GUITHDRAFT_136846 [Guillardia theta CCMP2712]|eukprot:XP_005835314.1 hypothetical protein GUITHDRAFT_136846 [Guillardia theta CCMP2712]
MHGGSVVPLEDDSMMARYYRSPLVTRAVCTLTVWLWLVDVILLPLWRWFTSPFVEQGIFGVLIGCLVFGGIGSQFERMFGTLAFGYLFMVINVSANILFTFAALFFAPILPEMHLLSPLNCANGLWVSVLAFLVIHTQRSPHPFMSFWGLCNIPTKFYPWFLLILFALLGASVLENLCGILVGYAFQFGYLERVMPSEQKFSSWETSRGHLTWTGALVSYPTDGGGGLGNWMSSSTGQSQSSTARNFFLLSLPGLWPFASLMGLKGLPHRNLAGGLGERPAAQSQPQRVDPETMEDNLIRLCEMGFDRAKAQRALEEHHGNLEAAAASLTQ